MNAHRSLLTAIIEDAYGDGKAATAALQVLNVKVTALSTSKIENTTMKTGFGHDAVLQAGANTQLEFEVALAGSGAAGTAPAFGSYLRACGLAENISVGTSVTYDPASTDLDSLSMFYNMDGEVHQLKGARGDVSISLKALDKPTLKFTFTGIYVPVVASALPTPAWADTAQPVPVANGTTTMGGDLSATPVSNLEMTIGNTVAYRNLINLEEVLIKERKSGLKVTFDRPAIATKNWFADVLAGTSTAITINHGKTAGNKFELSAAKIQPTELQLGEAENTNQLDLTARLLSVGGSGDDEFSLVFT